MPVKPKILTHPPSKGQKVAPLSTLSTKCQYEFNSLLFTTCRHLVRTKRKAHEMPRNAPPMAIALTESQGRGKEAGTTTIDTRQRPREERPRQVNRPLHAAYAISMTGSEDTPRRTQQDAPVAVRCSRATTTTAATRMLWGASRSVKRSARCVHSSAIAPASHDIYNVGNGGEREGRTSPGTSESDASWTTLTGDSAIRSRHRSCGWSTGACRGGPRKD